MKTFSSLMYLLLLAANVCGAEDRADLEYFPSRLHAVIFRNWDIVPAERIARVLGTDKRTLRSTGKAMGLPEPERISPEMQRRNVELVIRRNWDLVPRGQIEGLLDYTAKELDEFLGKEIFLRALLSSPPPGLTALKYQEPTTGVGARVQRLAARLKKHYSAVAGSPVEPRMAFTNELCQAHDPADYIPGSKPKAGDADLRLGWSIAIPDDASVLLRDAAADFVEYCEKVQRTKRLRVITGERKPGARMIGLNIGNAGTNRGAFLLRVETNGIVVRASDERAASVGR